MATLSQAVNAEFAPDELFEVYDLVHAAFEAAVLSGIKGNPVSHTSGYHRSLAWCLVGGAFRGNDYSVFLDEDTEGVDENACSGLDLSFPSDPAALYRLTRRLIEMARAGDPRLACLREILGSYDGKSAIGYDLVGGGFRTPDASHNWHLHLSILRRYCTNRAVMRGLASAIVEALTGTAPIGGALSEEDDMNEQQANDLAQVKADTGNLWNKVIAVQDSIDGYKGVRDGVAWSHTLLAGLYDVVRQIGEKVGVTVPDVDEAELAANLLPLLLGPLLAALKDAGTGVSEADIETALRNVLGSLDGKVQA